MRNQAKVSPARPPARRRRRVAIVAAVPGQRWRAADVTTAEKRLPSLGWKSKKTRPPGGAPGPRAAPGHPRSRSHRARGWIFQEGARHTGRVGRKCKRIDCLTYAMTSNYDSRGAVLTTTTARPPATTTTRNECWQFHSALRYSGRPEWRARGASSGCGSAARPSSATWRRVSACTRCGKRGRAGATLCIPPPTNTSPSRRRRRRRSRSGETSRRPPPEFYCVCGRFRVVPPSASPTPLSASLWHVCPV